MALLNPYLHFNGNAEEAFNFYKSVFGGDFAVVMRFDQMPGEQKPPENEKNKIMHIALPVGKGNMLMGSDIPESYPQAVTGTNSSISVTADSEDEAKKLFAGLSNGGNVMMPLEKAFWGALFGMLTDKYAVQWMVSYDSNRHE